MVPAAARIAGIPGTRQLEWRLDVWGRVRGRVDVGHPFVIEVLTDGQLSSGTRPDGDPPSRD